MCHWEKGFKAFELDAADVLLDIRDECWGEKEVAASGQRYDNGFCNPFPGGHRKKSKGIQAMSLEMESAMHCFGMAFHSDASVRSYATVLHHLTP